MGLAAFDRRGSKRQSHVLRDHQTLWEFSAQATVGWRREPKGQQKHTMKYFLFTLARLALNGRCCSRAVDLPQKAVIRGKLQRFHCRGYVVRFSLRAAFWMFFDKPITGGWWLASLQGYRLGKHSYGGRPHHSGDRLVGDIPELLFFQGGQPRNSGDGLVEEHLQGSRRSGGSCVAGVPIN